MAVNGIEYASTRHSLVVGGDLEPALDAVVFDQAGDQPALLCLRHERLQKRGGGGIFRFGANRLLHRGIATIQNSYAR